MKQLINRAIGAFTGRGPVASAPSKVEPVLSPQALGENAVSTNLTMEELLTVFGGASRSASGKPVTPETAMRVSALYACAALVAGAIASLKLAFYKRDGGDQEQVFDHQYWYLLNESPCAEMSAYTFWEYILLSKFLYGDGFAELVRASYRSSTVLALRPLHPQSVSPFLHTDGQVYYRITVNGKQRVLNAADVLHFPSLGFDGLTSPSPVTFAAREALGTAMSAEEYTAKFFNEGATFDYALSTDKNLGETQIKNLTAQFVARVAGSRAPLILAGGLKPAQLSVNPKDAEILSTRLFSVEEICRIFGVPPHMIGHTDKTTSWGSGIESQGTGFVRYTLSRHLVSIAQELNRKLWPVRGGIFVEHDTSLLEKADTATRNNSYRTALGRAGEPGWMTVNEVRRRENLPPVPGGDEINKGTPDEPADETPADGADGAEQKDGGEAV
jgi:HK97 family phage portal protein